MRVFTVICFSLCPATGESSHCNTPVLCPVPKYFRSFLTESRSFRRTRTVFTHEQLKLMEERFNEDKYLSTHGRNDFARQLKLTPLQVKTWFQNRRMKQKRKRSEDTERRAKLSFLNSLACSMQHSYHGYQPNYEHRPPTYADTPLVLRSELPSKYACPPASPWSNLPFYPPPPPYWGRYPGPY